MDKGLKKLRYPQGDLFLIDALDVAVKDDMTSMEHPIYSLSKNPVKEIDPYEHKGMRIDFRPSHKGFPTIYDKDLIIYAISHVIATLNEGQEPPRRVEFDPHDFLVFTQRSTGGKGYDSLCDSVERLKGSYFKTNVRINGEVIDEWRGIVDGAKIVTDEKTGKPKKIEIQLADMVLETIRSRSVLTLNKDYFRLKKPIERRLYELARKHLGTEKNAWSPYLATLHKKSGSKASLKEFRRSVRAIAETDHLPDFNIEFNSAEDQVIFTPKNKFKLAYRNPTATLPPLETWAYEKASEHLARNTSVYDEEIKWRDHWQKKGCIRIENVNSAFIGWCKRIGNLTPTT